MCEGVSMCMRVYVEYHFQINCVLGIELILYPCHKNM